MGAPGFPRPANRAFAAHGAGCECAVWRDRRASGRFRRARAGRCAAARMEGAREATEWGVAAGVSWSVGQVECFDGPVKAGTKFRDAKWIAEIVTRAELARFDRGNDRSVLHKRDD